MTRAGLTAFALASLAAVSLAVAQPPKTTSVTTRPEIKSEVPEAAPSMAKPSDQHGAAVLASAPSSDTKAPEVGAPLRDVPAVVIQEVPPKTDETSAAPSPAAPPAPPPVTLVAKVDLSSQRMTVFENGQAKFTWTISSGAQGYDTPRGMFKPQWMAKDWYSRKYDNAPMPHSVFFKDGAAIHGTMNPGSLGTAASHGCVRLSRPNAAVFFDLVRRHSMAQTRIHVFGKPRHHPDLVASRPPSRQPSAASVGRVQMAPLPYAVSSSYQGYGSSQRLVYPGDPVRVVQHGARAIRY